MLTILRDVLGCFLRVAIGLLHFTGALLHVAQTVDPDGMRAWLNRALALPRPRGSESWSGEFRVWQADAALAFYLAPYDRPAARALLAPSLAALTQGVADWRDSDWDIAFAAWAVIDPEDAAARASACGWRGQAVVGYVLAREPADRREFVQGKYVGLWIIGKEDI